MSFKSVKCSGGGQFVVFQHLSSKYRIGAREKKKKLQQSGADKNREQYPSLYILRISMHFACLTGSASIKTAIRTAAMENNRARSRTPPGQRRTNDSTFCFNPDASDAEGSADPAESDFASESGAAAADSDYVANEPGLSLPDVLFNDESLSLQDLLSLKQGIKCILEAIDISDLNDITWHNFLEDVCQAADAKWNGFEGNVTPELSPTTLARLYAYDTSQCVKIDNLREASPRMFTVVPQMLNLVSQMVSDDRYQGHVHDLDFVKADLQQIENALPGALQRVA